MYEMLFVSLLLAVLLIFATGLTVFAETSSRADCFDGNCGYITPLSEIIPPKDIKLYR